MPESIDFPASGSAWVPRSTPPLRRIADFTQEGGEAAAERLLARSPQLDGLFAASDLMALGALRALRRAGRRVPDDIGLVGFDDIEVARSAAPPLTTVRQSTVEQGRTMARIMLARTRPGFAAGDPHGDPQADPQADSEPDPGGSTAGRDRTDRVVLPVELVVRESA